MKKFITLSNLQRFLANIKNLFVLKEEMNIVEYYVSDDWKLEIRKRNKITKEDIID